MPADTQKSLADLISTFAGSVPFVQQALDEEYLHARGELLKCISGLPQAAQIAAAMAPSRHVIHETQLEASYTASTRQSSALSISVKPLNIGYERKFAHAKYVRQHISVRVTTNSVVNKESRNG